jgi:hypothetical protein
MAGAAARQYTVAGDRNVLLGGFMAHTQSAVVHSAHTHPAGSPPQHPSGDPQAGGTTPPRLLPVSQPSGLGLGADELAIHPATQPGPRKPGRADPRLKLTATHITHTRLLAAGCVALCALAASPAFAQQRAQQVVRPPVSQAWIDLATHASDIPGMGMMGSMMGGGGMPSLGSIFGRGKGGENKDGGNVFGQTRMTMAPGQWMDVSVYTRTNPGLTDATQAIPAGMRLGNTLALQAPQPTSTEPAPPAPREEDTREPEYQKPKGKLMLYWGCGEAIRAGQPRVLDFATMNPQDVQRIMVMRGNTPAGPRSQPGFPSWPSKPDSRKVPTGAQLAGENAFTGQGIVDGFRFNLPPANDFMPAIRMEQGNNGGATVLNWNNIDVARAYFLSAFGGKGGSRGGGMPGMPGGGGDEGAEVILWTSSEQPDMGWGLQDYQRQGDLDKWLKEKVLLPAGSTSCTIPRGIFDGAQGMLRMIAFGPEFNTAFPPRPTDVKVPWEPQWAARVRTKSTFMSMLGMDPGMRRAQEGQQQQEQKKPSAVDILRGVLGR